MGTSALRAAMAAAAILLSPLSAAAQTSEINIGISLSTSDYGAALGIPERNAIEFGPKDIGGSRLKITVLDDAGDPARAASNARRLATDIKADVLIGSSVSPAAIAIAQVASEIGVPHFSLALIPLSLDQRKWSVVMPQPVPLMARALLDHMKKNGVKSIGYIGFSDSYGEQWSNELKAEGPPAGLSIIADERYLRSDASVTAQVLKLVASKPDAILIGASGEGAALPQVALRERGYHGPIYQTHGAASSDLIRIAGRSAEGVIMASGPVMAPEGLDDSALTRRPGLALNAAYEKKYGADSRNQFSAHMYDVFEVLKRIVPVALKSARPGTAEFREAIRQALTTERDIAASQGVYNITETDRTGLDDRARILLTVRGGKFVVVK